MKLFIYPVVWQIFFFVVIYEGFNRLDVAGAVMPCDYLSQSVSNPFPPDIHNILNPKPIELES